MLETLVLLAVLVCAIIYIYKNVNPKYQMWIWIVLATIVFYIILSYFGLFNGFEWHSHWRHEG